MNNFDMLNNKHLKNLSNDDILKSDKTDSLMKKYILKNVYKSLYDGQKDVNITIEDVVGVVSKEFPELVLAIAEECFIKGYEQALNDEEEVTKIMLEQRKKVST